jgi:hypothetical protein
MLCFAWGWPVGAETCSEQTEYNKEIKIISCDCGYIFEKYRMIKSRMVWWQGTVAWVGEKRNAYRLLVRKPEEKRPLGRPRRGWVDNIRMDLYIGWVHVGEVGRGDVDWTGLVWLRIGTGGELLWIRYWTFGFHEMLGNYRVASGVVLSSIQLVSCPLPLLVFTAQV